MSNISEKNIKFEKNVSFDILLKDNLNTENILPIIRQFVSISKNDSEVIRAVELALCTCIKNHPVDDLEDIFQFACPAGTSVFVNKIKYLEEQSSLTVDECVASFNLCLKVVSYFQNVFEFLNKVEKITISRVESLLTSSLNILLKCFTHCKNSEEVYGAAFSSLTESLSGFFKKCCNLLDTLLNFLTEKSVLDLESEREILMLDVLLAQVSKCGIVMINLEVKTMAKIWKMYIYMLEKYLCVLKIEHKIGDTVGALCEVLISNVEALKNEESSKLIKLSCFLLKLIIRLCEIFKNELSGCHQFLFNLLLILSKYDSNLTGRKNEKENLQNQLAIGVDPLLSFLLADEHLVREFGTCGDAQEKEEFSLLCCLVLKKLSHSNNSVRSLWINEKENIFDWLFTSASTSQFIGFSSVRLPNVIINWQQLKFTDLYEYTLVTASSFLITASAYEFSLVEKILIRNVLQPNLIPALLAMDIWCFLARIADSDLCYNQIIALSEIYRKFHINTERVEKCFLGSLIRRLFFFLTDNRQKEYLKCFPYAFHSSIWNTRGVRCIPLDEVCNVIRPIISECDHLIRKTECKFAQVVNENEHMIYLVFGAQIIDLWKFNCELLPLDPECVKFLKIACGLIACILSFAAPEELHSVLSQIKKLLYVRTQPTAVKLYFFWILDALSSVSVPAGNHQKKILLAIAEIFRELLSSKEILVKQKAFEIFESFTRVTAHEEVISLTVQNSSELKMEILDYFKKKPMGCTPNGVDQYLRRLLKLKYEHVCEKKEYEPGLSVKRIKLDVPDLKVVLTRFREDGEMIREFARSLSESQKKEIKKICSSVLSKV